MNDKLAEILDISKKWRTLKNKISSRYRENRVYVDGRFHVNKEPI